ncbi:hypothetical protein ACIO13_04610 [Streptomyces sp. NPDC087425]|uniref:hypothetical protein n=1 Tax=unclassified Streptomyces TaxID=2593676 RepID=UPI003800772F
MLAEAHETDQLLNDMTHLSDLGDGPQLRWTIDQFMRRNAEQSPVVAWLPFLAQALCGALGEVGEGHLASLEAELPGTAVHVRVLTSAALAHADAGRGAEASRCAERAAGIVEHMMTEASQPSEALAVAQAFAHAGDAERAAWWAAPAYGRRPTGKAGIVRRRAALAVEMGLNPQAVVARALSDGLPRASLTSSGTDLFEALCHQAAGARIDMRIASLETTARARLGTEPLIATGLALLHALRGDTERARATAAELPDPAARGVAQATVAACLSGTPAHVDVTAPEDLWTLSMLRTFAHHACPAPPAPRTVVQGLVLDALGTSSWYWALPVLGRETPAAVHRVVEVLTQHQRGGRSREGA